MDNETYLQKHSMLASISESFDLNSDIDFLINNTLMITGEVMQADRAVLSEYDKGNGTLICRYRLGESCGNAECAPFAKGVFLYDEFARSDFDSIVINDIASSGYAEAKERGAGAVFAIPVSTNGSLWGVLELEKKAGSRWEDAEKESSGLIAKIFSNALTRQALEWEMNVIFDFFHILNNPVFEIDTQIIIIKAYSEEFTFAGYSLSELKNRSLGDFICGEDFEKLSAVLGDAAKNRGSVKEFYCRVNGVGGALYDYTLAVLPVYNVYGTCTGYRATYGDITQQKETERVLLAAKDAAESANNTKSEFLSRMSHEMRTPMNAIIGMTSIAKNASDIEKKDFCLEKIDAASKHLLGVINDILDMSKIDSGKFNLVVSEFNIEEMLINLGGILSMQIDEKKQNFIAEISEDVPLTVTGDGQRLAQVISNLLSNAIKFTPDNGTIRVDVSLESECEDGCVLKIEVTDNGVGISAEQQEKLFKAFEQGDGSIARRYGGVGLGLYLCKHIVEQMDGHISVASELGRGAKFTFTVSVRKGKKSKARPFSEIEVKKNVCLLAIDDSPEIQDYFSRVCRAMNIRCDAVSSHEVVVLAEQNKRAPYGLVLLNLRAPYDNGLELAGKLKALSPETHIVAMISVTGWNEVEPRAAKAGVSSFVSKPLLPSVLADCVGKFGRGSEEHDVQATWVVKPEREAGRDPAAADNENNEDIKETEKGENKKMDNEAKGKGYEGIIDVEGGMKRLANNKKLYFRLLTSFKGRQMADEVIKSVSEGDTAKVSAAAHAIKGVASNLGLEKLAETAKAIEEQAKMKVIADNASELIDKSAEEAIAAIQVLLAEEGA